ncbi:interleukin-6 receptor subunit beta-like isoform X2 [Hoplias malabaricus]|uniref:interleukin-6 receptor subunit beta-like isoform X2 n=1 Tax=Hoplias malabaricus TaxID=27720 RepID=UPI003462D4FF
MRTSLFIMVVFLQPLCKGIVECHLEGIVLGGTVVQTYSAPRNILCIGKSNIIEVNANVTCTWDHDSNNIKTNYTVHFKWEKPTGLNEQTSCQSEKTKSCTMQCLLDIENLRISVTAQNSAGEARSEEVAYDNIWSIVQFDPPGDITVKNEGSGLRVTWANQQEHFNDCEVRFLAKGLELVERPVENASQGTFLLNDVKQCTNYTVSVRCRHTGLLWTQWSQNETHLTSLNVTNVPFHLWRSKSVLSHEGKRKISFMWKGIHPSCKAFDEYRLFDNITLTKRLNPSEDFTFIVVDENAHTVSVAAFLNNVSLTEVSIQIPSTAEDLNFPPVNNVSWFAWDSQIHMSWDVSQPTVNGFIIVWNTTEHDHKWQQTQERQFTLKGKNRILYNISITPLYETGPGNATTFLSYAQEGSLANVTTVQAERVSNRNAEIRWRPILPTQCCAFVVNYTVFYQSRHGTALKHRTVDKLQHSVVLDDLEPNTTYTVFVQANSMASSSKSAPYIFSTKTYGDEFGIMVMILGVVLMLLIVCTVLGVLIRREYLNQKVPNPQFSSVSLWSSQKFGNSISQLSSPWACDSEERSLTYQVKEEDYSILTTSIRDMAKLKQMTTIQEPTKKDDITLVSSYQIGVAHEDCLKASRQNSDAVGFQDESIHSVLLSESSYRIQIPLNSPVDLDGKDFPGSVNLFSSEETETLLTPKLKNTSLFTTYVTVDMFQHGHGHGS